jgi:hypothetical protein
MLSISQNKFEGEGYWRNPIPSYLQDWNDYPSPSYVEIFDQNGYDLTELECLYARANNAKVAAHRYKQTLKVNWFEQTLKLSGAVLNHSFLFERKGYKDGAANQLQEWCYKNPTLYKVLQYRPKWGLDFSMDYVDTSGNCFEILHWEYDGFDYNEIQNVKQFVEPKLLSIDWEDAGKKLLQRKSEWYGLDFFAQSDWKCNYFNLMPERFKMVAWK